MKRAEEALREADRDHRLSELQLRLRRHERQRPKPLPRRHAKHGEVLARRGADDRGGLATARHRHPELRPAVDDVRVRHDQPGGAIEDPAGARARRLAVAHDLNERGRRRYLPHGVLDRGLRVAAAADRAGGEQHDERSHQRDCGAAEHERPPERALLAHERALDRGVARRSTASDAAGPPRARHRGAAAARVLAGGGREDRLADLYLLRPV